MIIFLVVSTIIRLSGFNASAIWYDEAISRFRAMHPAITWMLMRDSGGVYWDYFLSLFSHGPLWLLRLPSLLCSVLALWVAWRLMDKLDFTKAQRIISCIALATLPGMLWTAQDARCYAALSAVYMLALWFAITAKPWRLAIAVAILGYIHTTGFILGISALAIGLIYMPFRSVLKASLGVLAWIPPIVVPYLVPWISSLGSAAVPGDSSIYSFWLHDIDILGSLGRAAFVDTIIPELGGLFVIIILVISFFRRQAFPMTLAVLLPFFLLWLASVLYTPMLFYRPLIPLMIPLCLVAGIGLWPAKGNWSVLIPLSAFVLLISVVRWDPSARGGHVDALANTINNAWQPGDRLIYTTATVALPMDYYLHRPSCILEWGDNNLSPYYLEWEHCGDLTTPGRYWYVYPHEILVKTPEPVGVHFGSSSGGWQFGRIDIILVTKE